MDENQQDKTESKLIATEDKLSPPSLSTKDHRRPHRPQNNRMGAIIKRLGFFGYDKETKEYTPNGQLAKITKEHQPGKTFWDWLQLLIIPIILASATIAFGWWQAHLAEVQHQQDQQNALDQQRTVILQTYIDNIQDLLLNHNLLKSKPTDDVAILARARTLTALQGLDPGRKGRLLIFLHEAQLIGFKDTNGRIHDRIIDLKDADLYDTVLPSSNSDLSGSDLSGSDLSGSNLSSTVLLGAVLPNANLESADLRNANLPNAILESADLKDADLRDADLYGADLRFANLERADLRDAALWDALLSHADLSGIINLTQQQLDQVSNCKGAILPNGLTCHRAPSP
jgi:uncharacterized protein YjbI with pentapeptide repeats